MNEKWLSPDELYGELFRRIQFEKVFPDTKTFVDCIPKESPEEILQIYEKEKNSSHFNLLTFVEKYFQLPDSPGKSYVSDRTMSTVDHIHQLWDILCRSADSSIHRSSLIPLPYSYIVPGGRFREIFYWDSYFTMLGLVSSPNGLSLVENMIDNFVYLMNCFGFIPNGNRTYFASRSQPPFFALMIQLLADFHSNPKSIREKYVITLHKEYQFWMKDQHQLTSTHRFEQVIDHVCLSPASRDSVQHVVRLDDGEIVNRYYSSIGRARPEAFPKEEMECEEAQNCFGLTAEEFYCHNRAACESGWDFSSRWLADGKSKASNRCAHLVPIDLNCLIYFLESFLSLIYAEQNSIELTQLFEKLANQRRNTIQKYFWNNQYKFFMDYDPIHHQTTSILSLAGVYPLFFQIATKDQAEFVYRRLRDDFLQCGGLLTTLHQTGQQWDSPMGWAPLQWISYQAMKNYGYHQFAEQIRSRWINLNDRIFQQTGKMLEKYNVTDYVRGEGGNYPLQDGFGWTNGVYIRLLHG